MDTNVLFLVFLHKIQPGDQIIHVPIFLLYITMKQYIFNHVQKLFFQYFEVYRVHIMAYVKL